MAYTLTAAQIAALEAERDNLQTTLNTYDSDGFINTTNAAVDSATELDNAVQDVWRSASASSDGVIPVETVLAQLDGQTLSNPIPNSDGDSTAGTVPILLQMGGIRDVINQIQDLATSEPFKISNSARIRLNVNRYYPDVDVKDDRVDADARDVFRDHPWEAWEGNEGVELDYTGLTTIYQAGIFGTDGGRGTPGTTSQNSSGMTIDNPATPGTAQTTIDDGGVACTIGDNERFFIAMGNYLETAHSTGSIAGTTNVASSVSNLSVGSTTIAGTCTLTSSATATGTTDPATYSPSVNDVLSINGGVVRVVAITSGGSASCSTTGMSPNEMTTCTTTTGIRYVILTRTNPSDGAFTAGSQGAQSDTGTKRADYLALKRFTIARAKSDTTTPPQIATPAINAQAEVDSEQVRLIADLGGISSGLYVTRYNVANTRCNWNNGTVASLVSRLASRANLFNPQTLIDQGIDNPFTGLPVDLATFMNEYTRTRDKIAELQAILDGSS